MKNAAKTVKCSQEEKENPLGRTGTGAHQLALRTLPCRAYLKPNKKKQKERDTRVEQEDSIKMKLPGWVPNNDDIALEQYNKLTEENKKRVIRYIENLKAGQYTPEL